MAWRSGAVTMGADEERWLVERARSDPDAFGALYDRYFPRVYAYVRRRVDRTQDAEDLVAETFLKAIAAIDGFAWRHHASFAAWLFRIAHNLVANFRQRRLPDNVYPLDAVRERPSAGESPEAAALRREQAELLGRQLRALAPRRQEIIALRFFGGLRNREIAAVLDLDERTVAAHLSRGLADLHRAYLAETPQSQAEAHHD